MADKAAETANPLDMWRQFITDSERQWNGFFKEVLGTDGFSSSMNTWVEASLTVQRLIADNLERYYTTFNIPTHNDLVALGERMKAIEETLARLETALAQTNPKLAAVVRPARRKPARTKRPAVAAARSSSGSGAYR
jgi:hypothetical protein